MEVSTTGVNFTNNLTQGGTALQPVLVSGTNIKTINGASLLGSGNIPVVTSPSGVSGAIQFSDGSAFASDATKFFWDDTNNRLGIGTNTPASALDVNGTADGVTAIRFKSQFSAFGTLWGDNTQVGICRNFRGTGGNACLSLGAVGVGVRTGGDHTAVATLDIKGTGSTSATTSLLVQNSAGSNAFRVNDDQSVGLYSNSQVCFNSTALPNNNNGFRILTLGSGKTFLDGWSDGTSKAQNYPLVIGSRVNNTGSNATNSTTAENGTPVVFGSDVYDASALVQMNSTTRGFLPPRMTTTQKNAIASPAAGLVLYDSTTNKLCCYNGSTWNDLF
jgi:hypothetical protein